MKINKNNIIFISLIFIISIINLRYFFQPGIFKAQDLENHLARIANYYLAVKDGHIPPRWAKNLNHKFGYPVFNYNYPLANILAYPLIVVGFSIEDSLKIILFSAYFLAGLFFYLWIKRHFSAWAAFIGAVFYICAPYVFLDLYVRGVVGENLSFALFPAILYFLDLLIEKISYFRFLLLTFTIALFALSHNIMVLIFTPLIIIYWFFLSKSKKSTIINKTSLISIILGFLLTSFFWIPALAEIKYVNLEAFNPKNFYLDHFVSLKQLIYSKWQYGYSGQNQTTSMSFQIGPIHLILMLFSLGLFIWGKFKKIDRNILIFGLSIFWLSIFLMLPVSKFVWKLIPILGYLQFPWRFLSMVMFAVALIAAAVSNKHKFIGLLLVVGCFGYSLQFTKPFLWDKQPDANYYDFLFTTTVRHENTPRWFNESNIEKFKDRVISPAGILSYKEIEWRTGIHKYEISIAQNNNVWEHTAYFPGWEVYIDDKKTEIIYDNKDYPGLIGFNVTAGKHEILTKFTEKTSTRLIGDSLSFLSFLAIIGGIKYISKSKIKA